MTEKRREGIVLGIDLGARRIGLAVSDALGLIAHGLPTLHVTPDTDVVEAIHRVACEQGASEIVIGLPLNLDGTRGAAAQHAEHVAAALRERSGLPVHLWDERLTTAQAHRRLKQGRLSRKQRTQRADRVAAQILLQSFLDSRSR